MMKALSPSMVSHFLRGTKKQTHDDSPKPGNIKQRHKKVVIQIAASSSALSVAANSSLQCMSERTSKTAAAGSEMDEMSQCETDPISLPVGRLGPLYQSCHTGRIRFPEDETRVRSTCATDSVATPLYVACLSGKIHFPEDDLRVEPPTPTNRRSFVLSIFGRERVISNCSRIRTK